MSSDIVVFDHGSISVVVPQSEAAEQWLDDNVAVSQTWGSKGIVVEHRYIGALVDGLVVAGFGVSRRRVP